MPLPALEEMGRRSEELRRQAALGKTPGEDSLLPSLSDIAAPALSTLAAAGDVLSRPAYGLSEAYGEYQEGGTATDALEGLLRGVSGGFREAQHPTFGERAVPVEEGESFGRKAGRFGVDVITDPLTIFGGPALKAAGKGAIAAGRFAKGTKLAKAFGESDVAQSLSRAIMGTDYNMSAFGGLEGKVAVGRARRGLENARRMSAEPQHVVSQAVRQLGVKASDEDFWTRVTEAIEKGDLAGATPESQMAQVLRSEYDKWNDALSGFRDDIGEGFQTFNPKTGASAPFRSEPNYAARFLRPDIAEKMFGSEGIAKSAERLAKQLGITKKEAEHIVKYETGRIKKAGNIEYARLSDDPSLFDRNALRNFVKYTDQASKRLALAEEFGVNHGKLQSLLDRAMDRAASRGLERGFKKTVATFRQGVEGRYEPSPLAGVASDILGYQVLAKMGPTSVIAQFGQHVNTAVQQGVGNYVRGLYKVTTDSGMRQRSMMAVRGAVEAQMEQLVGRAGAAGRGGIGARAAQKYLRAIGFNFADELPRRITFAGAISAVERKALDAARKGLGWSRDLGKMGITKREFDDFASMMQGGFKPKFSPTTEAKIGLRASKATQFEPDFITLPPLWQTPEMRIAMQFRSFIHQQSRFLWEGVMKPAIRYMDTGGKSGEIAPLARALMMYPIAGQGVAAARELFREATARAAGIKRDKRFKRKFDYKHPLAQLARDSLYVGAFGIGGDILEQASRGQLLEWMAGPTVTDVTGTFERLYGTGQSALEGDFPTLEDVATTGARHFPGRRLLPLTPRELGEGFMDKFK